MKKLEYIITADELLFFSCPGETEIKSEVVEVNIDFVFPLAFHKFTHFLLHFNYFLGMAQTHP